MKGIYDFELKRIDGKPQSLKDFHGKVMLLVNVASKCGLTPQYEGLEALYRTYKDRGVEILGFPANEFLAQEPGSNEEIADFCRSSYGVDFPLFEKIVVRGEGQHPLYSFLTNAQTTALDTNNGALEKRLSDKGLGRKNPQDLLWNFEKFLVSKEGEVVARFNPDMIPEAKEIKDALEIELSK